MYIVHINVYTNVQTNVHTNPRLDTEEDVNFKYILKNFLIYKSVTLETDSIYHNNM